MSAASASGHSATSAVTPSRFFRFREERGWGGAQPVVGFAPSEVVEAIVTDEEMSTLFGGHVEYEDGSGHRYRGV